MQPDIWLALITLTFWKLFLGWIILFFFHWWWQNFRYHNKIWRVNWFKLRDDYADIIADIHCVAFTYYPAAFTKADAGDFVPHVDSARGGLFLIYKAIQEIIREELSPAQEDEHGSGSRQLSLCGAIVQIMLLDIVFSLDSVITAVGLSAYIYHDCRRNDCRRCHDVCGENNW